MINTWMIYLIGILDSVSVSLFLCTAATLIFIVFSMMSLCIEKEVLPFTKTITVIACCSIILNTFIPSSKTAAAMIIIPAIANNENLQTVSSNTLEGLRLLTSEWIEELKPKPSKD